MTIQIGDKIYYSEEYIKELEERINKAIEYIKTKEVDFVDVHYQQQDDYFNDLLNILKGEK